MTTATDDPGKLIDEARLYRKYASSARSLIAVLRVAPYEVAIEKPSGLLKWLKGRSIGVQPRWEAVTGIDNEVLQEALFILRDRYEQRARDLEERVIVKPKEKP